MCFGLLQEKLDQPVPARAHLVVLARRRDARADDERHHPALPERAGTHFPDPLANLEIDPLRPLNNLLWGYIQDEQHRLTVARRNYEYDHHYGLRLQGKAVQNFRPADSRSKFLEAFHHLLRLCTVFYKQDDDTTVKADAFPVLNALKEVHLILSQGAHNQFGDLPSTARIEMLMQQWLLARPEFREFLPTRIMVRLSRALDGSRRCHEEAAGLDRHQRAALPQPRRSSASSCCCRSATATGARSMSRPRRSTGRASGARRSRATSTPTAR